MKEWNEGSTLLCSFHSHLLPFHFNAVDYEFVNLVHFLFPFLSLIHFITSEWGTNERVNEKEWEKKEESETNQKEKSQIPLLFLSLLFYSVNFSLAFHFIEKERRREREIKNKTTQFINFISFWSNRSSLFLLFFLFSN